VFVAGWGLLGFGVWFSLMVYPATKKMTPSPQSGSQIQTVQQSPGSTNIQAGRDVVIQVPQARAPIAQLVVEASLTGTLKEGAELPPGEQDFLPTGDAHAYLEGPPGPVRLAFQSPVRFRVQGGTSLVTTNRFALPDGSELRNRPVEALANFDKLLVPIVTVVWGKTIDKMKLLEVTLSVNGEDVWYASWPYDVAFHEGPVFKVDLDPFHRRLRGAR
jgi:hypothetical protein